MGESVLPDGDCAGWNICKVKGVWRRRGDWAGRWWPRIYGQECCTL